MFSELKKLILLIVLLLSGCATMNRSECLTADWRMIGLEDGSHGRALAYIGEHRKACAEYQVSPDLVLYRQGHTQGLQLYCTYPKGYSLGKQGSSFKSVCAADLEEDFRLGYQRGRTIYRISQEIQRTESSIKSLLKHLEELDAELLYKETLLVSADTSTAERILLLVEIKDIREEIDGLEDEISMLEQHQSVKRHERSMLQQEYLAESG